MTEFECVKDFPPELKKVWAEPTTYRWKNRICTIEKTTPYLM